MSEEVSSMLLPSRASCTRSLLPSPSHRTPPTQVTLSQGLPGRSEEANRTIKISHGLVTNPSWGSP